MISSDYWRSPKRPGRPLWSSVETLIWSPSKSPGKMFLTRFLPVSCPSGSFLNREPALQVRLRKLRIHQSYQPKFVRTVFSDEVQPQDGLLLWGTRHLPGPPRFPGFYRANGGLRVTLLFPQQGCLSAPQEVSTWTKFCEVDIHNPLGNRTYLSSDFTTTIQCLQRSWKSLLWR